MSTPRIPSSSRKPMRLTATVPYEVYERIAERADYEGRSMANLIAYLLDRGTRPPE